MIQKQSLTLYIPKSLSFPSLLYNNHMLSTDDGTGSVVGTRKIKEDTGLCSLFPYNHCKILEQRVFTLAHSTVLNEGLRK